MPGPAPHPDARDSARIIAFPVRSEARLAQALATLEAALGAQRAAMEGFRRSLAVLGTQIDRLEGGLVRYRTRLDGLGADVAGLRLQACELKTLAASASPRSSA